jgi:hypothetical protein
MMTAHGFHSVRLLCDSGIIVEPETASSPAALFVITIFDAQSLTHLFLNIILELISSMVRSHHSGVRLRGGGKE